jgi:hypothetical protein
MGKEVGRGRSGLRDRHRGQAEERNGTGSGTGRRGRQDRQAVRQAKDTG